MTRAQYEALPGVNFSLLKKYMQSPIHFKYAFDNQEEDVELTKALLLGKAIHTHVLEPEKFEKQFSFIDFEQRPVKLNSKGGVADYRTKLNAEWKQMLTDAATMDGKHMLASKDDYETILSMSESVKNNKAAVSLLKGCKSEEVIQWTDAETGVKCKAIVDFNNVDKAIYGDLKSMESAAPSAIGNYIQKWLTHVQLAFYGDGLDAIHKKAFNTAFIIAVEKTAPNICQPYFLDESDIELGRSVYRSLLNIHKKCVESGKFGSYDSMYENVNGVLIAKLPEWVKAKTEADEKLQNN